jgi:hypothetical protein
MSAVSKPPKPLPAVRSDGAARRLRQTLGGLAAVVGVVLVLLGGGAVALQLAAADSDGFFSSDETRLGTGTYALTSDDVEIDSLAGLPDGLAGTVRVAAHPRGDKPLFVGIARRRDVERYLGGVARARVTDGTAFEGGIARYSVRRGGAPLVAPGDRDFWAASSQGAGVRSIDWPVTSGRWAVVVMNADGSGGVQAEVRAGAKLPWLLATGIGVGVLGFVLVGVGGAVLGTGARGRRG